MDTTEIVDTWIAAERGADAVTLKGLLHEDFRGIGPLGFVLNKDQWTNRFDAGLVNEEFAVEETTLRTFGDTSVLTGVQRQRTTYQGNPSHGRFRVTVVLVGAAIVNIQLSLIEWL